MISQISYIQNIKFIQQISQMDENNKSPSRMILTAGEKVSLIEKLLSSAKQSTPLPYSYDPRASQFTGEEKERQYTYRHHNSKNTKKVSHSILSQRREDYQKQILAQEAEEEPNRYFHPSPLCLKCAKVGHTRQLCPYEYRCLFCLSFSHRQDKCPQKTICFKCFDIGHSQSNCKRKERAKPCSKCERSHVDKCYFLTKGKDRRKQLFSTESLYNNPLLKCMKCMQTGHLVCKH